MKSRLINSVCAIGQRLPRAAFPARPRLSQTGIALGGAVCVLTLSGCYYPYGYYPGGYYPYYATVPAAGTQQAVPVGQDDPSAMQQLSNNSNRHCKRNSSSCRLSQAGRRPMQSRPRPSMSRRLIPLTIRRRSIRPITAIRVGMGTVGLDWLRFRRLLLHGDGGHGGWGGHGHWH